MDEFIPNDWDGPGFLCVIPRTPEGEGVRVTRYQRNPSEIASIAGARSGPGAGVAVTRAIRFEDCPLAETLVHLELAQQGFKALKGTDVFDCDESIAVEALTIVQARIEAQDTEIDAERLMESAQRVLAKPNPSSAELLNALSSLEHALNLGNPLAGYLGAQTALELMGRKSDNALQEDRLAKRAARLYSLSGEAGVVRAWADLALLRHWQQNENASRSCWAFYFTAFSETPPPPEELQYLAELLRTHYFSKGCAEDELLFLKNNKIVVAAGFKYFAKDREYLSWLKNHAWTPTDFLIEKGRIPLLGLGALGLLYLVQPTWALGVLFCGAVYLVLKRKKLKQSKR